MKKKIIFKTIMTSLLMLSLPLCFTSCNNENISSSEIDDIVPDPWDGYNTKKYSKTYKVAYDKEEVFNGMTSVMSNGNRIWSGFIGYKAERGGHYYPASNAELSGTVHEENGSLQYIENGDKIVYKFSSDDVCLALLEMNLSVNPELYPDGVPAKNIFSISYGENEANMSADISDCWVESTGRWDIYSLNNVCEIPLNIGNNIIEISCYSGFNLEGIILVPPKAYIENNRTQYNYSGEELLIEAENVNSSIVDCRIEYDIDKYHGEGAISNTTSSSSVEFVVNSNNECDVQFVISAAFSNNGINQLDERLYFVNNGKYLDLYDYDDDGKPIGDIVYINNSEGNWYEHYYEYTLPKSLHLVQGENVIKIEAGGDGFNLDYFILK